MTKNKIKEVFLEQINPYFEKQGYEYYNSSEVPSFVKKQNKVVFTSFFQVKNSLHIEFAKISISHLEVEEIIIALGSPVNDYKAFKNSSRNYLTTVQDKLGNMKNLDKLQLQTQGQIISIADAFKIYLQTDGQKFIDTYSYLPNVLKEMDRLEKEGLYWHEGILGGGPDYMFRGLIISKLCNDPDFDRKLRMIDDIFQEHDLDDWQPYYDKLKTILPGIQPKYNI